MLCWTVGTVVFLPIGLPFLIPGQAADPWPILRSLLLTMLLPLSIGIAIRNRSERWALRLRPAMGRVSNVSMLLAIVVLIGIHIEAMLGTFGSGAVAVAVLFVFLLLVSGYLLGGPAPGSRSVLGLGSGQRNIAAALIVATQNSEDPRVVVMLIASTLAGLIVLVPAAIWLSRRATANHPATTASFAEPVREEALR